MDEIFGWILTMHNGKLSIERKEMEVILMEDLGYTDVSYNEDTSYNEQSCWEDSSTDYTVYSEEDCYIPQECEEIDEEDLAELSRFFTDGLEIERQGDTMVFLLDETSANVSERALDKLSNLKISR